MRNTPLRAFAKNSPVKAGDPTETAAKEGVTSVVKQGAKRLGGGALAAGLSKVATVAGAVGHLVSAYKEGKKTGFKHSTNTGQFQKNVEESKKKGWAAHRNKA